MVAAIMLQGTGSHVGKSLLVAGLGRAYARLGLAVRPFKPQNMSNNAAVTEGGEIGRAQALQARACRVGPSVHMNPVLLKPEGEKGAQVIVQGQVWDSLSAAQYHRLKPHLLEKVLESFRRVAGEADLVLVEGAGSPAEVNLREGDIANMGFAVAADLPVLLVGDIERGGVIASIVGTHALLEPDERRRLKGYIVNKFRGDPRLFADAPPIIAQRTGLAMLGVVPWFAAAERLPAEDSLSLPRHAAANGAIRVAVPRLPRIANFDDLDPLRAEPDVTVELVAPWRPLPVADLVILPGSKSTIADLAAFRAEGWDVDLAAHRRRGGFVLGLCGGYQMLGRRIADPGGIEGAAGEAIGLAQLDVETVLGPDKTLAEARGTDVATGAPVKGYEIHLGRTHGPDTARPMLRLDDRPDGATSPDGRVQGCYLHGLFSSDVFRHAYLARIGARTPSGVSYEAEVETTLDALADHLVRHLQLGRILEIARGG